MNQANALRGTFMGRRVKTEGEALAEIAAEQSGPSTDEAQLDTSVPLAVGGSSLETNVEDEFKFERLTREDDGWSLNGLEVLEGRWGKITLLDQRMTSQGVLTTPERLIAHSDGLLDVNDIGGLPFLMKKERLSHIAPTRTLYWFMRAAITDTTSDWTELINFFKREGPQSIGGESIEYSSNKYRSGMAYWSKATINTVGWPLWHPMFKSEQVNLHTNATSYPVATHTPPEPLVKALTGDSDMLRVNEVFKRIYGFNEQLQFDLPTLTSVYSKFYAGFRAMNSYGPGKKYHCIDASHTSSGHTTAFLLRADASKFTSRVKP